MLFKSKQQKELEKKMLMNRTKNNMSKQIQTLEQQKEKYKEAAIKAKQLNSQSQLNLALSGYKMAAAQQRRIQEMLLNFELTSQMKDMSQSTVDFLEGMSMFSKDIARLTKNSDFLKVQAQFELAMQGVEETTEKLDMFLETSDGSFGSFADKTAGEGNKELLDIIDREAAEKETEKDTGIDAEIQRELANIEKSLGGSGEKG